MAQTLYWYDLETFGRHPGWDRMAQFAGIRTDENFTPLEEPLLLYCRIPKDYLPDPRSCLITGITPQETLEKGLTEYEFIQKIHREFSRPGTCVTGYNSIKFDDEFIRYGFYRNFFDPYRREYANGNSRWDLLSLVRAAHDLRPEGLNWPRSAEGKPSFRLEELTAANGIGHADAHDDLADVRATIALARKLYQAQPKLFRYAYKNRRKEEIKGLIDLYEKKPFLHTSALFTGEKGCTTLSVPLAVDPVNRNCILSFDLRTSPEDLLNLPVEEVRRRIFTPQAQLAPREHRVPLYGLHVNKSPFLAPVETMDDTAAERLGLDRALCLEHARMLKEAPGITQKVLKIFENPEPAGPKDPDLQIYSGGFFRDEDREGFEKIHHTPPEKLAWIRHNFEDSRIPEMLWRFRGRNFPETLSDQERKRWKSFCAGRLLFPPLEEALDMGKFEKIIDALGSSKDLPPRDKVLLKELDTYKSQLKKEILDYHE